MTYALDVLEVELESPHFVHKISDSTLACIFVRCTLNLTLEIIKIVFEIVLPKIKCLAINCRQTSHYFEEFREFKRTYVKLKYSSPGFTSPCK